MEFTRQDRVAEQLAHLAAEFLRFESNRQSLITVTRANMSPDYARCTIFVSVLPESEEEHAINFLKRNRPEFKNYIKKHTAMKKIPFFDFMLDLGEKHRQHLDEITRSQQGA